MAPFRGGRGGRGANRGRGQPAFRGSGKLARSGIKTRAGYRKFDSQRVKDVDASDSEVEAAGVVEEPEQDYESPSDDDELESVPKVKAYSTLLQSFQQPAEQNGRKRKRRKLNLEDEAKHTGGHAEQADDVGVEAEEEGAEEEVDILGGNGIGEDAEDASDPFEVHFANPDDNELSRRLNSIQVGQWRTEKHAVSKFDALTVSAPQCVQGKIIRKLNLKTPAALKLKKRLLESAQKHIPSFSSLQQTLAPYTTNYSDVLVGSRTPENAGELRQVACLHALNHVLKGRDKVLKNNARQSHSGEDLDIRDQGFTRPKVLMLTETRQMCFKYATCLAQLFESEQQENKQRFETSFNAPLDDRDINLAEDHRELFSGNNDNNFLTAIKLTRKTMKFYSAFYTSDVILASPLGLRRILENEDPKKRDYDFLSSIEIAIVDQADAMQMQNWENVEVVFNHLNLQLKEAHGCDFSRVRPYYLDGNARYLRQTMVFSAYTTPEMNRLFNTQMQNVAGKVKIMPTYHQGAISAVSNIGGIKQTFSRFDAFSPTADPDARFKYFTTAVLPSLLRLPKPAEGGQGILIFVPSYYDFLRLRNHFATSTQTENVSFGAIHEYSDVSSQRRARAHFLSGRHAFLFYTQRAHHFFRLRVKGVRRVVLYGLPDNPVFYEELGAGFLGTSLQEGRVQAEEAGVRVMFSRWDGLKLERTVGSQRVKGMLSGGGDTFEFV